MKSRLRPAYEKSVFINCPFDAEHQDLLLALVFVVAAHGFVPRSARETEGDGEPRFSRILATIAGSKYSIHDLTRSTGEGGDNLARFNMPLELGIDLGCQAFHPDCKDKSLLIFDSERYRFQKFVSDLSGQDIHQHGNSPKVAVTRVRDWLRTESGRADLPGGAAIYSRYERFRVELPAICSELRLDVTDLAFVDFSYAIARWLKTPS